MSRHLIHKQKVTMHLSRKEEAFAFQNRVSHLLQNGMNDSLEDVLDHAFPPDKIVRIDSLSIDLGNISAQNFEQEFKARFVETLTKILSLKSEDLAISKDEEAVLSKAQSLVKALIFFLERGYLPWYSSVEKTADWENEVLATLSESEYRYFLRWLRDNHKEDSVVIERLALQFSDRFIAELLSKIAPAFDEPWALVFADYAFIINNISGSGVIKPRGKKEKKTGNSTVHENFRSKLHPTDIRQKIGQYALSALLDTNDSNPGFTILKLLSLHFGVTNKDIPAPTKNSIGDALRTNTVRRAFEKLVDFLHNETNNSRNDESGVRKDELPDKHETAGADAANAASISAENKTPAGSPPESTSRTDGKNAPDSANGKDAGPISLQSQPSTENKNAGIENAENIAVKNKAAAGGDHTVADVSETAADLSDTGTDVSPTTGDGDPANDTSTRNKKEAGTDAPGGITNENDDRSKVAAPARNKKKNLPHTGDVINVNNSGVVILHPFLKAYFTDLDLFVDGNFINAEGRARAVMLLHYLATGEVDAAEFELTLQKILCGYPLEDTLTSSIILTDKEKAGSDNLLIAVTNHWEPLKHTSIAGLRGTFLQREGNIELKESGWLLKVEQRGFDILLGKLPWGYSTIRLPWMQNLLSVDWY